MIDSESIFLKSVDLAFKKTGIEVPHDVIIDMIGRKKEDSHEIVVRTLNGRADVEEFWKVFYEIREEIIKNEGVGIKKGCVELFEYLDSHHIDRAIGTSSDSYRVNQLLGITHLENGFKVYVDGDMVENGKPNPDIYLKCLELGKVKPEEAIVFEDSLNGLLSAVNAGIRCVLVPDLSVIPEEDKKKAYMVLDNLLEAIPLFENGQL